MTCGRSVVFSGYSGFLYKTDRYDITETLLKVALSTININHHSSSIKESADVFVFSYLHNTSYDHLYRFAAFFWGLEFYFREARLSLCIVLSVSIRFAASDYFFDIFKLFLRSSRSKKGRQPNGKNKHDKGTHNDVQNTTQKEKRLSNTNPTINRGRDQMSSSCSTSCTHSVVA